MQNKHESDDRSKIDWQNLPVHPAAEMLPMMTDEGIEELRRDILENGLLEPIDVFVDNHAEANGSNGPFPKSLLEGRNRWETLRRESHKSPLEVNTRGVRYKYAIKYDRKRKGWVPDCDPYAYVLSKNVHRRHLTADQKRDAIAAYIKHDPNASNREVAKKIKVSHHTVADVREKTAPNGRNAHLTPMERAKAAIAENPNASGRELAKMRVSERPRSGARSKKPAVTPEPEPTPTEPAAIDASAKAEAASSRKDLIDEISADVKVALNPVLAKWRDNPDVDWSLFVAAIKQFIQAETGANY